MDISKMTVLDLKALKCDLYEKMALAQKDLQLINSRIAQLLQEREKQEKPNKK